MMRLLPLLFLLVPLIVAKDYSVSVTLDAKWNDTPYVAEISEFLASEDPSLFWHYLDSISALVAEDKLAPTEDGEAVLSAALSVAKARLSEGHVALLELALASRAYSPAVEMNNQLSAAAASNFSTFPCAADAKFWITFARQPVCSLEQLDALLKDGRAAREAEAEAAAASGVAELRLRTDKVFGRGAGQARSEKLPSAVLYADLRYKEMYGAHEALKAASLEGKVEYVFRHRIVNINNAKTRLNGFGIELAIKSTEYKAMDDTKINKGDPGTEGKNAAVEEQVAGFDFAVLRARYPNLTEELNTFRQHLMETATEIVPLKAWQLQDLSFQAAQRVANAGAGSREAMVLETLEDVSQNYPLRAHSLSKISVTPSFRSEVLRIQADLDQHLGLSAGTSAFFVNGFLINDHDPFAILELLRREQKLMQGLHNIGVKGTQINKILRTQLPDSSSGSSSSKFLLDIREMPIAYLNDLEDGSSRYYGWPSSVRALLEQTFPGMLRRVAKNLFHLILVVDPSDPECWAILRYAQAFVMHAAPVRIGLVWVVPPAAEAGQLSVGEAMVRAFNFIKKEEDDGLPGLDFLLSLVNQVEGKSVLTMDIVREAFVKRYSSASADRVFDPASSKFGDQIQESRRYMSDSGLSPKLPQALMNGALLDRKQVKDMFEETVVGTILEQTPLLQKEVYEGRLTDSNTALDVLMGRPEVVSRLNQRILESEGATFLNLGRMGQADTKIAISALDNDDLVERLASSLRYVSKKEDQPMLRPVSLWLATDVTRPAGRAAVLSALKLIRSTSKLRLALIHTAPFVSGGGKAVDELVQTTQTALEFLPAHTARLFLAKLLKEENVEAMRAGQRTLKDVAVSDMDVADFAKHAASLGPEYAELHAAVAKRVLRCSSEAFSAVVANGKVLGPLTEAQIFGMEDLRLLERVTLEVGGANALADRLESMSWAGKSRDDLSELAMRVNALLQASAAVSEQTLASAASKRRYAPLEINALATASEAVLRLFGDLSRPTFELVAVLDPLSRDAQKLSSILRVLRQAINCNLHVFFSCKSKLSEPPLKNFYRLAWTSRVTSPEYGRALFAGMPGAPLLTLGMDAPHSWLVAAVRSPTDLDNIRLKDVASGRVAAHFELEHLLLEGHCVDTVTGQPPRGLQFTLGGRKDAPEVDTIVMANLGYFQLKANPGAWFLELRAGRSADIYDISGHEFADSLPEAADLIAVVDSLRSKIIRVRVSKKKDKLDANLLGDDEAAGGMGAGLWNSISNAFGGSKKKAGNHEVLNIFSVASGHLYERFLRIMMLSVLKHTKQPVKFWFLKNYLSPTFKDFIPHMAKAYDFQYELVEYRWPRWLHQQTEKQRIIWGYKILFLDVLFPLDVQKIIFVDADQIVRTDLQELADLDLEGAPYGYTPFCDSRREMDGFRFWKSGYWAGHLGHRRYHISALYVVDLVRFRRLAAGDRLRGQYQGLSQDPNSLSNLDQDLPNNMIHQVPIKSLPQEWLWCDTWCAKEELARAKTIDLCNNPMTKEPKLSAAMRIVPEWKDYDQEVKRLWDKVYGTRTAELNQTADKKKKEEEQKKKEEL